MLAAVLAVGWCVEHRQTGKARREKEQAELQAGLRASQVLSAKFEETGSLRAARLRGEVLAQGACTSGYLFANGQQTVAPYSVDYMVDLTQMGGSSFRWNAAKHTMFVTLPALTVERPAVDMSRARSRQSGTFISRACGLAMQKTVAGRLGAAASERAGGADYLRRARDSARARVASLVQTPLAAAGIGPVRVVVRLSTDPVPVGDQYWDMSRPIEEIVGNATSDP